MKTPSLLCVGFLLLSACGKKRSDQATDPAYRVIVSPTSADDGNTHYSSSTDWTLTFKFTVPPLPSASTWNAATQVIYVWGDVSFDEYGSSGKWPLSSYLYNQIVPQLEVGWAVSSSDSSYNPSSASFTTWKMQAQYFWMSSGGDDFVQVGNLVDVNPGDAITETIAYTAVDGKIVATISSAAGTSTITIPRPFPNESTPLFSSWKDFLQQAEARSTYAYGLGVMNVETHAVDQSTLCSILPWKIQQISGPAFPTLGSNFILSQSGSFSCPTDQVTMQF